MRYGFQIMISMGHLYGVIIYYTTSLAELWFLGSSHSRPEALYFWVYFVGFNAPWFFIPIILIWSALKEIARAWQIASQKDTQPMSTSKLKAS
jgi:cholestenol delta-isomerase